MRPWPVLCHRPDLASDPKHQEANALHVSQRLHMPSTKGLLWGSALSALLVSLPLADAECGFATAFWAYASMAHVLQASTGPRPRRQSEAQENRDLLAL